MIFDLICRKCMFAPELLLSSLQMTLPRLLLAGQSKWLQFQTMKKYVSARRDLGAVIPGVGKGTIEDLEHTFQFIRVISWKWDSTNLSSRILGISSGTTSFLETASIGWNSGVEHGTFYRTLPGKLRSLDLLYAISLNVKYIWIFEISWTFLLHLINLSIICRVAY